MSRAPSPAPKPSSSTSFILFKDRIASIRSRSAPTVPNPSSRSHLPHLEPSSGTASLRSRSAPTAAGCSAPQWTAHSGCGTFPPPGVCRCVWWLGRVGRGKALPLILSESRLSDFFPSQPLPLFLQVMSLGGPPVTALSLSPALDLLTTTHSDRRGLYLWANQVSKQGEAGGPGGNVGRDVKGINQGGSQGVGWQTCRSGRRKGYLGIAFAVVTFDA